MSKKAASVSEALALLSRSSAGYTVFCEPYVQREYYLY